MQVTAKITVVRVVKLSKLSGAPNANHTVTQPGVGESGEEGLPEFCACQPRLTTYPSEAGSELVDLSRQGIVSASYSRSSADRESSAGLLLFLAAGPSRRTIYSVLRLAETAYGFNRQVFRPRMQRAAATIQQIATARSLEPPSLARVGHDRPSAQHNSRVSSF